MINLLTLATFAAIAGLVFLLAKRFANLHRDPIGDELASGGRDGTRELDPWTVSWAAQLPAKSGASGTLDQELRRAGFYHRAAAQEFLGFRNALIILAIVVAGTIAVMIGPERQEIAVRALIGGAIAAVFCWALPRLWLRQRGEQRVKRIRRSLPDALDLVTMCVSGGISLGDALEHVSREIHFAHSDLAVELMIVRQQSNLDSLEFALQEFAARVDTEEIKSMAALLTHGQRLGTDVVGAIRDFADMLRLQRRQMADEVSSKIGVQLLFPLTFCLLPSVLLILWGPAVLEMVEFFQTFEGASDVLDETALRN